jgi:hypothetical protein
MYDTDADIPKPILDGTLMNNIKNPFKTSGRIADAGEEGTGGRIRTLLMQALGASAGGGVGLAAGMRGKGSGKAKVAGGALGLLGSALGISGGGMAAQSMHNDQSSAQFGKALKGALSPRDMERLPAGLLKLIEAGKAEKVRALLPMNAPDIANRPYVKNLMDSQRPR